MSTYYRYEMQAMVGANKTRPREQDWSGRVSRISWFDSSEGAQVERVITRVRDFKNQARLFFPGNVPVRFNYGGNDLTSVPLTS